MKKILVVLLAMLLLTGCSGGNTDHVQIDTGTSARYEEAEIIEAMDLVLRKFEKGFEGCYMTKLWYDEAASADEAAAWAREYDAEEAIVLYCNYWVDGSGRNPTQTPNSMYKNWNWILVRNGRKWELKDWGY